MSSGGNQSIISQRMSVSRSAVSMYLSNNKDMKELCEQEGERIIDVSENVLDNDIVKNKSVDSAKWKLSNSKRGKNRGYGFKLETEHSGQQQIIIHEVVKTNEQIKEMKNGKGLDFK